LTYDFPPQYLSQFFNKSVTAESIDITALMKQKLEFYKKVNRQFLK